MSQPLLVPPRSPLARLGRGKLGKAASCSKDSFTVLGDGVRAALVSNEDNQAAASQKNEVPYQRMEPLSKRGIDDVLGCNITEEENDDPEE